MKKRSILVTSLLGLALVACTDDDLSNSVENATLDEGGVVVSLKLDIASPETKGNPTKEPSVAGSEAENTVSSATVVIDYEGGDTKVITASTSAAEGQPSISENTITFKAPEGAATFYVYANAQDADNLATTWTTDLVSKASSASAYYTNSKFFMSNQDGKGVEHTINEDGENNITVNIERGAAKISVESEAQIEGDAGGTLHKLSFGLENMISNFYLLAQSTITEIPSTTTVSYDDTKDSDFKTVNFTTTAYQDGDRKDDADLESLPALYCLENLHTSYNQENTTAVVFKAEFTPGKALDLEKIDPASGDDKYKVKSDLKTVTAGATASTFYVVRGVDAGYESLNSAYLMAGDLTDKTSDITISTDADTDGHYTITGIEGITKVDKYENGECWFYTWVNNETDEDASPIYRNDWYHLNVTKITLPGSPTKPDLNDPDKPLVTDTDIEVKATVVDWHWVDRDIELK